MSQEIVIKGIVIGGAWLLGGTLVTLGFAHWCKYQRDRDERDERDRLRRERLALWTEQQRSRSA